MFYQWLLNPLVAFSGRQAPEVPKVVSGEKAGRTETGGSLPYYLEVSRQAGIQFTLTCGRREKRAIIESLAGGVAWIDYNNDGYPDLFPVNSTTWEDWRAGLGQSSRLFRNNKDGTFTDVTARSGLKRVGWGMGVAVGDYDHDGRLDLVKTNFSDDADNLYHNNGEGTFSDVAFAAGLGELTWPALAFGAEFLDFDNDGRKDIFMANGHVNPEVDTTSTGITYAERNFLFRNLRNGRFGEIGQQAGPALGLRKVSRGVAVADYDNDGQPEILVTNLDSTPDLLRNARPNANHSVLVKTLGRESNRNGYGARIQVTAGDLVQLDEVRSCGSYLSASDARCHFGLGQATTMERLEIRWPAGRLETLTHLPADHVLILEEGKGLIEAIPFKKRRPR